MQISGISPAVTVTNGDQPALSPIQAAVAAQKAQQKAAAAKPFEPAPELRPNVQDYVDINRTLLMLRQVGVKR